MPDMNVPQLQTVQQGQALQIILPNELPLATWYGMFFKRLQELPVLGWIIRAEMHGTRINTLPKLAISSSIFGLIWLILVYLKRRDYPDFPKNILPGLGLLSIPWLLLGAFKLYERKFTTCLELHPNELRIIERRPWGEQLLAAVPLEGAPEVEIQRAYTERDATLGGKRRCNLYIHHAGQRLLVARGLKEELCSQVIHNIERYVQERKALPTTTP